MSQFQTSPARRMLEMAGPAAPTIEDIAFQVRTAASVPFRPFMRGLDRRPLPPIRSDQVRTLQIWTFSVADTEAFHHWLEPREALMRENRLTGDPELTGLRYGGIYRMCDRAQFRCFWSFGSSDAAASFAALAHGEAVLLSLVQLDVLEFLTGLKRHARKLRVEELTLWNDDLPDGHSQTFGSKQGL